MYASYPLHWASQLQTEIALSTMESEFIGLSMALRMTIPIMETIKKLHRLGFRFGSTKPTVHCQVFEDNSGAIEIATMPKIRPRTKHINVKYHHFRDYVDQGEISINAIDSKDQPADMLTKPNPYKTLCKHHYKTMGWGGKLDIGRECEETRAVCSSKANALMNPSPRLPSRWDQVGRHRDQAPGTSNLKTSQQGTCQVHANCMLVHAGRMPTTHSTHLAHG